MTRLNVSILLFNTFSNMVLACLLEPLRVVRDQTGVDINWSILTHGDQPLDSSSGITVTPDMAISEAPKADLLLIIGGDDFREKDEKAPLGSSIKTLINTPTVIAADTGAWLIARCGYLDGCAATLHWQLQDEFAENFPETRLVKDRFVRDGRFWTCGSASAGLDLILLYIGDRFGVSVAFDAGAMFLHDNTRHYSDSFLNQALELKASSRLKRVLKKMSETLEQPMHIPDLARAVFISERGLHRLFRAELRITPGRYYLMLRLSRARELASNSNLSLVEIALRCGFSSSMTLSHSFQKNFGLSLHSLRKSR